MRIVKEETERSQEKSLKKDKRLLKIFISQAIFSYPASIFLIFNNIIELSEKTGMRFNYTSIGKLSKKLFICPRTVKIRLKFLCKAGFLTKYLIDGKRYAYGPSDDLLNFVRKYPYVKAVLAKWKWQNKSIENFTLEDFWRLAKEEIEPKINEKTHKKLGHFLNSEIGAFSSPKIGAFFCQFPTRTSNKNTKKYKKEKKYIKKESQKNILGKVSEKNTESFKNKKKSLLKRSEMKKCSMVREYKTLDELDKCHLTEDNKRKLLEVYPESVIIHYLSQVVKSQKIIRKVYTHPEEMIRKWISKDNALSIHRPKLTNLGKKNRKKIEEELKYLQKINPSKFWWRESGDKLVFVDNEKNESKFFYYNDLEFKKQLRTFRENLTGDDTQAIKDFAESLAEKYHKMLLQVSHNKTDKERHNDWQKRFNKAYGNKEGVRNNFNLRC